MEVEWGWKEVIVGQQGNCSTVPRHLQYIIVKGGGGMRVNGGHVAWTHVCIGFSVYRREEKGRENELLDYLQRLCLHDTLGCAPVLASCLGHQCPSVASLSGHQELHNLTSSDSSSGLWGSSSSSKPSTCQSLTQDLQKNEPRQQTRPKVTSLNKQRRQLGMHVTWQSRLKSQKGLGRVIISRLGKQNKKRSRGHV